MEQVRLQGIKDGRLVVVLSGDIDAGNADEFYGLVASAYDAAPADIRFECENLSFIDSTTLGTFVKLLKKVKLDSHSVALVGLPAKIKKLFLICSLDKIMEIA